MPSALKIVNAKRKIYKSKKSKPPTAKKSGGGGGGGVEVFRFSDGSLEEMRRSYRQWVLERDWEQYHSPRNLCLALGGEVGEVMEQFQWKHDSQCSRGLPHFSAEEKSRVSEELADVLAYLILLADACRIDLPAAYFEKQKKNSRKYPADVVRGSAKKYTEYRNKEKKK